MSVTVTLIRCRTGCFCLTDVRPDFAEAQREFRDEWVPGLAQAFATPGTARRLIARQEGRMVGVASIVGDVAMHRMIRRSDPTRAPAFQAT